MLETVARTCRNLPSAIKPWRNILSLISMRDVCSVWSVY